MCYIKTFKAEVDTDLRLRSQCFFINMLQESLSFLVLPAFFFLEELLIPKTKEEVIA